MAQSTNYGNLNMVSQVQEITNYPHSGKGESGQVDYQYQRVRDKGKSCYKCNKEFRDGDQIHTNGHPQNRKLYHINCWESMLY